MSAAAGWTVETVRGLADIPAAAWDACAGAEPGGVPPNPFVSHAFLHALEQAGCVGGRSGWAPAHQIMRGADGSLIAAAPAYVKSHSLGEYVFDHAWAEALERAGGQYYPKIQVAVPFTPASGPRLMVRSGLAPLPARMALLDGLEALRARIGGSSIHATFLPEDEAESFAARDYLLRSDRQFHWTDENFGSFEGFLAALSSRKRKMIRRERKEALASGLTVRWLTGAAITEADWDAFFAFYMNTGSRKWGRPYLNRRFFSLIGQSMAERIVLILACRGERPVAGAINFIGRDALFGRNWGAIEEQPFLHFEICYYQAMDFALAHGLKRIEAGAQGEHKLMRGYRPVLTRSAHALVHQGLRRAVADYLRREQDHIAAEKIELDNLAPFRRA